MAIFFVSETAVLHVGGSSQSQIFTTASGTLLVYSILVFTFSLFGHLAQYYQFRPLQAKYFNAPTIFRWFLYSLTCLTTAEIIGVVIAVYFTFSSQLKSSEQSLYAFFFNALFFAHAQDNSNAIHPKGFWTWISSNCPTGLSEANCLKPLVYSVGNCAADWNLCNQENGSGFACPFDICRDAVVSFASELILWAYFVFATFVFLHIIGVILGYFAYEDVEDFFIKHAVKFDKKRFNPKYTGSLTSISSADARRESGDYSTLHSAFPDSDARHNHLVDDPQNTPGTQSIGVRYIPFLTIVHEDIENLDPTPEPESSGDSLDDDNSDAVPLPDGVLDMVNDIMNNNIPRRVSKRIGDLVADQGTFSFLESLDSYEQRV